MAQTKEAESSVRMMSAEFESECKLMSKQTISLKQELGMCFLAGIIIVHISV